MAGAGDASGITERYVWGDGPDELIAWYEGSGGANRRWAHQDERGSVIAVSNAQDFPIVINRYDEYGRPQVTNHGRFQYTGQLLLPEIGLYHYKARAYAPHLGRFMQTDPIGYGDGPNMYAYVGNDPVNFVDPLGLCHAESVCGYRLPDISNFAALLGGSGGGGGDGGSLGSGLGGGGSDLPNSEPEPDETVTAPVNCGLHPADPRCNTRPAPLPIARPAFGMPSHYLASGPMVGAPGSSVTVTLPPAQPSPQRKRHWSCSILYSPEAYAKAANQQGYAAGAFAGIGYFLGGASEPLAALLAISAAKDAFLEELSRRNAC